MTREEAREFLLSIANQLGYIGVEDLTDRDGKRMIEAIKALEEPQWIPCSERLPEEDGLYLVTTSKGQVQVHVFSHNGNSEEYWMRCNKAWMPLPEPWRGDEE